MFLFAISANVPRLSELPTSDSEPSFDAACIICSSEEFTIWPWPLASIAMPAGCTPKLSSTSRPYFS